MDVLIDSVDTIPDEESELYEKLVKTFKSSSDLKKHKLLLLAKYNRKI